MCRRQRSCAALMAAGLLLTLSMAHDPAGAATHTYVWSAPRALTAATIANIRVSHDRFPDHAEPALAVDPRDPRDLLGAAMYFTGSPTPGTFASFDGGRTWRDNGALPLPAGASGGEDVSAAFDAHGTGFVAAGSATDDPNDRGVYVWRTDDGGRTFRHPVAVVSGQFVDHPWLAVDTTPGPMGGDLYVAWVTRHTCALRALRVRGAAACAQRHSRMAGHGLQEGVAFSRSVDGGRSFTPPRLISAPPGGVTAPVVAAGPCAPRALRVPGAAACAQRRRRMGGVVYVAYVTLTSGSAAARARAAAPTLVVEVVASTDHGRNFGHPVVVGPSVFGLTPQPGLLLPTGPMVTTDPRDGTVYVAYAAMHAGSGQADLVLARSRDGGRTWTTSVPVPAASLRDHAVAFQPRVAVDAAGTVAVSYLRLAHGRVDVLLAQSVTQGVGFGPPQRITTRSFDPALGLPGDKEGLWWIGDYQGLAAGPRIMHPCWGDTRTGHLEIFTAAVAGA